MRIYQLSYTGSTTLIKLQSHAETIKSAINSPQLLPDTLKIKGIKTENSAKESQLSDVAFIKYDLPFLLFSEAVYEQLSKLTDVSAQWLPVDIDGATYWLMNIVDVIDAIDRDKTFIEEYTFGNGYVDVEIDDVMMDESAIGDRWIFRDRVNSQKYCFCSEAFYKWFNDNGFTGLSFWPAYDSEHSPFKMSAGTKIALTRPEVYGPDGFFPGYAHLWTAASIASRDPNPDEMKVEIVQYDNDRLAKVAQRLTMYGIENDSAINLLSLPLRKDSTKGKERPLVIMAQSQAYYDFVNDVFMYAAGPDNARSALEYIKQELLSGRRDFGIDYHPESSAQD